MQVTHDPDAGRFEMMANGDLAFLSYTQEEGRMVIDHTFVPPGLRGRGIAASLVHAALVEARARQWRVEPQCSYVAAFMTEHQEFSDLLAK
jgi:predicted GNAT family acetyltransferase